MPKEIRRLAFSHEETAIAVRDHSQDSDIDFPEGSILHVRFATKDEESMDAKEFDNDKIFQTYNVNSSKNRVIFTLKEDGSSENNYANIGADFVVAALIEYCVKNKIMLPKSGTKNLDITGFHVCLDIQVESKKSDLEPLELEDDVASTLREILQS